MKQELSERLLASLKKNKPDSGRLEVSDTKRPGLRFRMSSSGRASWLFEKRVKGGQKRRHTLGTWPAVGLSEAREIALEIEAEATKGIDRVAIAEAEATERKRIEASTFTVLQVLDIYTEMHLSNLKRGNERRRQLNLALDSRYSDQISSLKRAEMQAVIDNIGLSGRVVFANRIKAALSAFTKWSWQRGYSDGDEGAGLRRAGKERARERAPSVEEVRAIYQATFDIGPLWGPVFRLLILTGQRRSEILNLKWSEIDLSAATITKPGSQTKNGKPHKTHLSPPALAELKALSGVGVRRQKSDLVFTTTDITPVSGVTKAKRRLDDLLGEDFEPWRLHDLRTSFATAMVEAGVPENVADRVLNHSAVGSAPSAVARVYNRAEMLDQRARALDCWAQITVSQCVEVDQQADKLIKLRGQVK